LRGSEPAASAWCSDTNNIRTTAANTCMQGNACTCLSLLQVHVAAGGTAEKRPAASHRVATPYRGHARSTCALGASTCTSSSTALSLECAKRDVYAIQENCGQNRRLPVSPAVQLAKQHWSPPCSNAAQHTQCS
jgi:hypothetical protein